MLCKYTYFLDTTTFGADGAKKEKERNLDTNKLLAHPEALYRAHCLFFILIDSMRNCFNVFKIDIARYFIVAAKKYLFFHPFGLIDTKIKFLFFLFCVINLVIYDQ